MVNNQPDHQLSEYLKISDIAFGQTLGVTYSGLTEIADTIDPNQTMLKQAARLQMPPNAFAKAFGKIYNFVENDSIGNSDIIVQTNERRAATIDFAQSRRLWKIGSDSAAYLNIENGRALKLDVGPTGNTWVISESVGTCNLQDKSTDKMGRILVNDKFAPVCEDIDIVDALSAELRLRPVRKSNWDLQAESVLEEQADSTMRI